ncbi:MAG: XdhC family protein [Solirubrobacterales bacterium]|nr:XdhC family protein [Solirubrobacterales bacterium]
MKDVLAKVDEWTRAGEACALATVVAVRRSAPRPPGAKMAVSAAGEVSGMVSGGCVEGSVAVEAREVIDGAPPRLLHYGIADAEAWEVGLPCGGEIDVWIERYDPGEFSRVAREDGRAVLVTAVEGDRLGGHLLVRADGSVEGDLDAAGVAADAEELMWAERSERRGDLFFDVTHPDPRLVIFGAVDYAAWLCRLARVCGWRPYVVDPRGFFARKDRFPEAEDVVAAWPEEAMERLGAIDRATYVAVLTHDPKLDDAAILLALRSDAPYIGAMGSRRANAARRERLLEAGCSEEDLARIASPIGLDLGAITAEETALSIMAEISAIRNGREGGRLIHSSAGRIHEVGAS